MMKGMYLLLLVFSSNLAATEWDPLNTEKSQTLDQHCALVSLFAGLYMESRQKGVPLDKLMEIADTPIGKEILMDAFGWPKMSTYQNQKSSENEFKSQWMLKCLKEHPAGKG